mmetsp:Transcript_14204/g.24967  ORF Transcript_14204/g.24967 Transcript_14204/m.24967 type:complete len:223 (-) Transcript_14204:28-696(-)
MAAVVTAHSCWSLVLRVNLHATWATLLVGRVSAPWETSLHLNAMPIHAMSARRITSWVDGIQTLVHQDLLQSQANLSASRRLRFWGKALTALETTPAARTVASVVNGMAEVSSGTAIRMDQHMSIKHPFAGAHRSCPWHRATWALGIALTRCKAVKCASQPAQKGTTSQVLWNASWATLLRSAASPIHARSRRRQGTVNLGTAHMSYNLPRVVNPHAMMATW